VDLSKYPLKRYESKFIDQLASVNSDITDEELFKMFPNGGPGANHQLLFATLDVIYHEDAKQAEYVCKAVANFARLVEARSKYDPKWGKIKENIGDIEGNTGIPTGLGELWLRGGSDFALSYDYLYNYMDAEQRKICRSSLSLATKDLVCWGMHFPRGRGVSNWYGYHGEFGPMLLAMARRGENHYDRPNIRNYFKWVVLSLVPGEDTGETVGYTSSRVNPYESAPVMARWAMPGNKCVNYYLRQYKGEDYSKQNRWQYAPMSTLFCMNWEESEDLPLDMAKLGLPITAVFDYQGLFITRSDWSDDAAYLNILARQDAWYDRHENVDRGRFVFAALGRRWAVDRYWGMALGSENHSLVHIDGSAQAEAKVENMERPAPTVANLVISRIIAVYAIRCT
jgi:hypothetical protein